MKHPRIRLIALVVCLVTAIAWGREDRLNSTGLTPAAEGKVVTSTDSNGNTAVDVQVKHLAAADKLTPARQTYLVWIQGRGEQPALLGVLKVNSSLEGSLKANTALKTFDIFITAEDNLQPATPSDAVVLKGTVERK